MHAGAPSPPTHLPITSALVKRIAAWGQTLHHTHRGSPARTGPNQHLPTHSCTHGKCRRGHRQPPVGQHTRCRRVGSTYQSRARASNESRPEGKHFTTHLEGPLYARDPTNTCPPTPHAHLLAPHPVLHTCCLLLPAAAAARLTANYASRTPTESPPHRKHYNTHREGPLHARDPTITCPTTPARTENAGAGIGSHR